MKLAVMMDTSRVSGPGRQLLALIPRLVDRGVDVHCIVFEAEGAAATPFRLQLDSSGIPHTVLRYHGRVDLTLIRKVAVAIDRIGPDIVQSHSYRPNAIAAVLSFRARGWRWVAFFHGATRENLRVRLYHVLDNLVMRLADRIVTVADQQRLRYRGPAPEVTVIHNAILNESPVDSAPFDPPLQCENVVRIAVVGRLSVEKGLDVFLYALSRLVKRHPAIQAVVVGEGEQLEALLALRSDLGLDGYVSFVGFVSPVEPVYEWCDLVVIPSRSEGMPNVLLEAIQAGCPVVATDVGNISQIVGQTGIASIVPPEDPERLAEAIERTLRHGRPGGADSARVELLDRFSLDRRVSDHLRLYQSLLGKRE